MENEDYKRELLEHLNEEQRAACTIEQNCVLMACPGSGKTRTIVYRLAWLRLCHPESRKLNIAITYTNRASEEMENRLQDMGVESTSAWTGTIHQFCMEFIVRKYSMYSERLRFGYKIIDEYQTDKYIKNIFHEQGITDKYYDWEKDNNILSIYKEKLIANKEIDFNDILSLSLTLLRCNPFIAENISKIISSIQIDEYQDTNESQYQILAEIYRHNPSITVMFVGDVNQAIYSNLGGVAKTTEEITRLFGTPFIELILHGCYRSTQRIINYYSEYAVNKVNITSKSNDCNVRGIITYNSSIKKKDVGAHIASIIRNEIANGVRENDICIVAPQWGYLYGISKELRNLLPDVNFDAPDITAFKYDPMNPFYLIASLLFTLPGNHEKLRKKKASEFLHIIQSDYNISFKRKYEALDLLETINKCRTDKWLYEGLDLYKFTVGEIFESAGIRFEDEAYLKTQYQTFIEKTEKRMSTYSLGRTVDDFESFFKEKQGIVITTLHSVKGEEYHTVIAFGLLNGILPHWDYIFNNNGLGKRRRCDTYRLLYVLLSRAKQNIFLISEKERYTKKGSEYTPTDELQQINIDFDPWPSI